MAMKVVQGKEPNALFYIALQSVGHLEWPDCWETSASADAVEKDAAGVDHRRYGISSMLFHCFCHLFWEAQAYQCYWFCMILLYMCGPISLICFPVYDFFEPER